MFKVGIGDKEYEVRFHYTEDKKKRRISNCEISDGNSMYVGVSMCAKTDNFVRTEGRKIALTRALQFFDREERTAFWKKYFEICKRS